MKEKILKWGVLGWTALCLLWFVWTWLFDADDLRAKAKSPFEGGLYEIAISLKLHKIAFTWVVPTVAAIVLHLFILKPKEPPASARPLPRPMGGLKSSAFGP